MRGCLFFLIVLYAILSIGLTLQQDHRHDSGAIGSDFAGVTRQSSSATKMPAALQSPHGLVEGNVDFYLTSSKPLWEHSSILPDWMKSYFDWHRQQRTFLRQHPDQWRSLKYHLVECTKRYPRCGGTADRLGSLPFHVQFAAASERLLLYHWTTPAPLESFLLPPSQGVDWRLPPWLRQEFETTLPFPRVKKNRQRNPLVHVVGGLPEMMEVLELPKDKQPLLVRAKTQSHDHGAKNYNDFAFLKAAQSSNSPHSNPHITNADLSHQPTFQQVFHDLWRVFYTPAPAIASKIEQQMSNLHLSPGSYIAMHLRLLYGKTELTPGQMRGWTQRMIHCTLQHLVPAFHGNAQVLPSSSTKTTIPPLLFVADSQESIRAAEEYAKQLGIPLVRRQHSNDQNPLHLEKHVPTEKVNNTNTHEATIIENLHDTFVDIYTIGMSRCVAYQNGGFGRWGSMMSYKSWCNFFLKPSAPETCPRPDLQNYISSHSEDIPLSLPLFLSPMPFDTMEGQDTEVSDSQTIMASNNPEPAHRTVVFEDRILYKANPDDADLWQEGSIAPAWMVEYFDWHKQQRLEMMTPTKWNQTKYLVMSCKEGRICGGTSDRLKPIPTMLRRAAMTKRILLIQWERPCKLEEFLLPPKGGFDWRVPDWLLPELSNDGTELLSTSNIWKYMDTPLRTVHSVFQAMDGGATWYNEQSEEGEASFQDVYHLVWSMMFAPVPQVASTIKTILDDNGLAPHEYTAAHLRVLYNKEDRKEAVLKKWTRGALNCASNLHPGQPIFLASDSAVVTEYGPTYGREQNGTVIIHQNNPNPPLHLDRADWNTTKPLRPPPDYYDTFTDLYLLALSGCLFHSKGGYGLWAAYINGNLTCGYRSKGWNKLQNECGEFQGSLDAAKVTTKVQNKQLFLEPVATS
ncbi:MAG: hypothetical protein SGILL_008472 [Bacillariaceae sp.]